MNIIHLHIYIYIHMYIYIYTYVCIYITYILTYLSSMSTIPVLAKGFSVLCGFSRAEKETPCPWRVRSDMSNQDTALGRWSVPAYIHIYLYLYICICIYRYQYIDVYIQNQDFLGAFWWYNSNTTSSPSGFVHLKLEGVQQRNPLSTLHHKTSQQAKLHQFHFDKSLWIV